MALVVKDRVKETTATTGTGTLTLAGAVTGFQTFSSALSDGDTTYYAIFEGSTGSWEVGLGTFTASGTTLARTTVLASSNSGSAVNLTAGAAEVFITQPATKAAYFDGSGDLVLNQDPTAALQAATKQYVDTIAAAGLHYHDPVRVEQEGNLNATYDNGTSGVGATLTNAGTQAALVIDGVTMVLNDRVLIYEQTNAAQNGVYTVTNVGSASTNWVLTRATDADSYAPSDPNSLGQGDAFFVSEGAAGAGETYVMNTEGTITFGTTDITFAQISSAQIYSAGNGLTLTGTTFAAGAGTGVTVNANDIAIGQDVGTTANVTFNTVTADLTGNVTGNVTGSSGSTTGNAATATALQTGRTISLTGDVTGTSAAFDGTGNVSISTTIGANSVALGTDTTGNYVSTGAVSGNGLSGSASAEGATFTVTSNATNANTASTIVFRDGSGNFSAGTITAALNGNATTATTATNATNADTVDGLHASSFLRSDATDTATGTIYFNDGPYFYGTSYWRVSSSDAALQRADARDESTNYSRLHWYGETDAGSTSNFRHAWYDGSAYINVTATSGGVDFTGSATHMTIGGNTVWNAGNDGAGSGLDADTIDGYQTSQSESTNTVAIRNGNGYLFSNYFNGSGTFATSGSSSGMVNFTGTNGSDTYGRSYNGTAARAAMNLSTTDSVTFAGLNINGNLNAVDNIYLAGALYHEGDTNTYLLYGTDIIYLVTGGTTRLYANNTQTYIKQPYFDAAAAEDYDVASGTSATLDVDNAGAFSLSMTGNTTFYFGTPSLGNVSTGFILELTGNASTAYTVTWPASVEWAGGTAPDAPAVGETDIYVFWTRNGGTTWYGVQSIDAAA